MKQYVGVMWKYSNKPPESPGAWHWSENIRLATPEECIAYSIGCTHIDQIKGNLTESSQLFDEPVIFKPRTTSKKLVVEF